MNGKWHIGGFLWIAVVVWWFAGCTGQSELNVYEDHFADEVQRTWIAPQYWANRLQDWRLNNGRIECLTVSPNRNVNLLTARIGETEGGFNVSARLGLSDLENLQGEENWLGFRVGIKGQFDDYRDDAIYGAGLDVGITSTGSLFIGELPVKHNGNAVMAVPALNTELILKLQVEYLNEKYQLLLEALDEDGKRISVIEKDDVPAQNLTGGIALVSHFPKVEKKVTGWCCWFDDWVVSGEKIDLHPERAFGPILFEQYTLSRGIMKMTVQLPPVGRDDEQTVQFQVLDKDKWNMVQEQQIDPLSRTAGFKVENWNFRDDTPYRLVYKLNEGGGKTKPYYLEGVIRKEPLDKDEVVIAGFTGNNDLGFPNTDLLNAVKYHNPDMMFFSGDQIYEGVAGFGVQRAPVNMAVLDYLRKWYLYGWAYGELMRDRPSISIPDDHDVYHGNIWGEEGKSTPLGKRGYDAQDAGGYKMPAEWVKMVERTQTSHLPDPYDPKPVLQGIGVYFTEFNYGGISFAILEDRKFKSAPKPMLPEAQISNGWYQNKNWDPVTQGDVDGAILLGDRQLDFLEHWAGDWSNNTWMKVALSQTIFANVATLPAGEYHDQVVPKLRILNAGEYPPDDFPVADMDSDGWPQTGRNKAIKAIRKAFAFHLAGDQHLGSVIKYGVDNWNDAGYAFCVPAISNVWPRRWFPSEPGLNREESAPRYTGDFLDGFGNKITVLAVSNPVFTGKKPSNLYDRATGYGIVRINRNTRNITMECWPRFVDPAATDSKQYPGWPITVNQMDSYERNAVGWLPKLEVRNMQNPVVRVYSESDDRLVYALRISGSIFEPRVFKSGSYRIEVGDPDSGKQKIFTGIKSNKKPGMSTLDVRFELITN